MFIQFTAVSAVVPSLLLIWYFHRRDLHPEPARVMWATFGLGVLTVVPVLLVALPTAAAIGQLEDPFAQGAAEAFLTAAVPEEFFKFLVVVLYARRHREFDEPMDGVVYGAVASLGFATLENVLYVASGGVGVAVLRAFTAVPGHAFMGAVMGYYVGRSKFARDGSGGALLLKGFAFAVVLHGLYDFPLLTLKALAARNNGQVPDSATGEAGSLVVLTLVVLVVEWVWAIALVRRLRREQVALAAAHPAPQGAAAPPYGAQAAGYPPQGAGPAYPYALPPYGYGYAPPPTGSANVGAWMMVVFGGLIASVGGLMTLGIVAALALTPGNESSVEQLGGALFALAIVGLLPLLGGGWMFGAGLRRLAAPTPPARAAGYF